MANGRTGTGTASCEGCFFGANLLCAVATGEPCATYRPNRPEGLRPPGQLRFVFRQERRLQVAWAFPSAHEQVAAYGPVAVAARERVGGAAREPVAVPA